MLPELAPTRGLLPVPADKCRELMAVNDPQRMLMVLHPSAKTILGANNLAFLHGPEHKAMRKSFVSLFTRKALSTYSELQVGLMGRPCLCGACVCVTDALNGSIRSVLG